MRSFTLPLILVLILTSLTFFSCEEYPQARLEQAGLSCPINDDFKATLDNYFASHPLPSIGEKWHRAIVLKKNREFTRKMNVHFLVYTEGVGLQNLTANMYASEVDLKTPVGGEIWFLDGKDNIVWDNEVKLINERVVCVPDTLIFDEGKK